MNAKGTRCTNRFHDVLALFRQGETFTITEAAKAIGVNRSTTRRHITRAHDERLIYIADWKRCVGRRYGGDWAAVYALGRKKDAPMPMRSVAIESKRYRAKYSGLIAARNAAERGTLNPFSQLLRACQ